MSPVPITVRYWAAARAAAGVDSEELAVEGPTTLADVVRRVREAHADERLNRTIQVCSALIGDRPAGTGDPESIVVEPGQSVEFLPPYAGG